MIPPVSRSAALSPEPGVHFGRYVGILGWNDRGNRHNIGDFWFVLVHDVQAGAQTPKQAGLPGVAAVSQFSPALGHDIDRILARSRSSLVIAGDRRAAAIVKMSAPSERTV